MAACMDHVLVQTVVMMLHTIRGSFSMLSHLVLLKILADPLLDGAEIIREELVTSHHLVLHMALAVI